MNVHMRRKWVIRWLTAITVFFLFIACSGHKGSGKEGIKSINGAKIYYKIIGKGDPVIVIHGGPVMSHQYLLAPLKPLARNYQLIFYDQRLSGQSSADVAKDDITLKNFVDDIEALRKSLKIDKVSLLGHSWGGLLAMKYALQYPQHLKKLVLADPMPASQKLWQKEEIAQARRTSAADRKAQQQILNSEGFKTHRPEAIKKLQLLSYKNQFHNPSLIDSLNLYIPDDYSKRARLFGNLMPDLRGYNLFPQLAKLQIPTLILYGADEPAATMSGKKLDETIPNSKLVIIENAGHFPFIEQPKQFLTLVNKFLKSAK